MANDVEHLLMCHLGFPGDTNHYKSIRTSPKEIKMRKNLMKTKIELLDSSFLLRYLIYTTQEMLS